MKGDDTLRRCCRLILLFEVCQILFALLFAVVLRGKTVSIGPRAALQGLAGSALTIAVLLRSLDGSERRRVFAPLREMSLGEFLWLSAALWAIQLPCGLLSGVCENLLNRAGYTPD
jgi:hypothetical protein